MFTQQNEITQEQIADARQLCKIRQSIQPEQWPLLRMIFTAYMDGIGTGLQLTGTDRRETMPEAFKKTNL